MIKSQSGSSQSKQVERKTHVRRGVQSKVGGGVQSKVGPYVHEYEGMIFWK